MEEEKNVSTWWVPLVFIGLLVIGGLVGHFAFPIVEKEFVIVPSNDVTNAQYGTWNISGLSVSLDERTGNCSIFGLRPGNFWIGDVAGISMWPTLKDGSYVIAEEVQPQDEIKVGDIVLFDYNGEYLVHRVTEVGTDRNGWYALTVGDNKDLVGDERPLYYTCRRSEIWGKVRVYIDY